MKPKHILCIEMNVIYPSLRAAAKALNLTYSNIHNMVMGRQKTAGGYTFKYI